MSIVFFDGTCGLCHRFIRFLLHYDRKHRLRFSPLQGKTIQKTAAMYMAGEESVVFLHNNHVWTKSRAAIESIVALGGIWAFAKILLCIPSCIRDGVYRYIVINRYRWFGRYTSCPTPSEEEQQFFLE